MAVQFVNQTPVTGVNTANITTTHTAEGTNRLLLAWAATTVAAEPSAVYFDGVAFTRLATATNSPRQASVWRLVNPTAGAATITFALKAVPGSAAAPGGPVFGVITVGSADQTTPIAETRANNGAATVAMSALTSVSSDWRSFPGLSKPGTVLSSAHNGLTSRLAATMVGGLQVAETTASSGILTTRWVENSAAWIILTPAVRHFVAAAGGITISPTAMPIVVAPQAANIAAGKAVSPGAINIILAPQAPGVAAGKQVAPGATQIAVGPQAGAVAAGKGVQPGATEIVLALQAAALAAGKAALPAATDIVVAPQAPNVAAGKAIQPSVYNIVFAPQDPTIQAGGIIIAPDVANIIFVPQDGSPAAGKALALGAAEVALAPQNAIIALVTGGAAVSGRLFSVYRGRTIRYTEGVRDFEKTVGDEFPADESE